MEQTKYKENDIVTINSKTSMNDRKLCRVVGYTKGKYNDIVRVRIGEKIFNIKEESISYASTYDVIRNMSDEELKELIPKHKRKKISKTLKRGTVHE